jgi:hypothetical protein
MAALSLYTSDKHTARMIFLLSFENTWSKNLMLYKNLVSFQLNCYFSGGDTEGRVFLLTYTLYWRASDE